MTTKPNSAEIAESIRALGPRVSRLADSQVDLAAALIAHEADGPLCEDAILAALARLEKRIPKAFISPSLIDVAPHQFSQPAAEPKSPPKAMNVYEPHKNEYLAILRQLAANDPNSPAARLKKPSEMAWWLRKEKVPLNRKSIETELAYIAKDEPARFYASAEVAANARKLGAFKRLSQIVTKENAL